MRKIAKLVGDWCLERQGVNLNAGPRLCSTPYIDLYAYLLSFTVVKMEGGRAAVSPCFACSGIAGSYEGQVLTSLCGNVGLGNTKMASVVILCDVNFIMTFATSASSTVRVPSETVKIEDTGGFRA